MDPHADAGLRLDDAGRLDGADRVHGGLGLGSYLAGKMADRLKHPARAYALVEASIGVYALLVPWS